MVNRACIKCIRSHKREPEEIPCLKAEKWGIDLLDDCDRLRKFYESEISQNIEAVRYYWFWKHSGLIR